MSATGPPRATFHHGPEIPISNQEAEDTTAVHHPGTVSYSEGESRKRKNKLTYWKLGGVQIRLVGRRAENFPPDAARVIGFLHWRPGGPGMPEAGRLGGDDPREIENGDRTGGVLASPSGTV